MSVSIDTVFTKLDAKDIDQGSDIKNVCNNQLCGSQWDSL